MFCVEYRVFAKIDITCVLILQCGVYGPPETTPTSGPLRRPQTEQLPQDHPCGGDNADNKATDERRLLRQVDVHLSPERAEHPRTHSPSEAVVARFADHVAEEPDRRALRRAPFTRTATQDSLQCVGGKLRTVPDGQPSAFGLSNDRGAIRRRRSDQAAVRHH